jgi:hypothetical protein
MSSEIQNITDNLHEKYNQMVTSDTLSSATHPELLEDEKRKLVEMALNQTFLNPKFKMERFVPSGQLTPYATVRQWLLELKSIEESCEKYISLMSKYDLEIPMLKAMIEAETDPIKQAELKIRLIDKEYNFTCDRRRKAQHFIEREQYCDLLKDYLAGPNGKTPDGRSWLEVFGNMDEENEWEKHYWTVRLAKQAAMDMVGYGKVSAGNIDAITQLDVKQQQEAIGLAHEVALRVDAMSDHLRNQAHRHLLETDNQYAGIMGNRKPDDLNRIEFNINDMIPKSVSHHSDPDAIDPEGSATPTISDEELNDVYRS